MIKRNDYCPLHTGLREGTDCTCPLTCQACGESIEAGQSAPYLRPAHHRECAMRLIVGSLAHLNRECTCYGGANTHDPPEGMTRREAAMAAVKLFMEQQARGEQLDDKRCRPQREMTTHGETEQREGSSGRARNSEGDEGD
jgi:hypothetical protein